MTAKLAALALLAFSGHIVALGKPALNDPVVLWLKGIHQPAVTAPDLGRQSINLNDGSWIVTEIHTVTSVRESTNKSAAAVGRLYSQTTSALVAYNRPGGAISLAVHRGSGLCSRWGSPIPDGQGGN